MEEIFFRPKLHFFICTNDREGRSPSCFPKIKTEDVKAVKQWIREQGWTMQVYCTNCKCLGFCNTEGGVLCVWPKGRFVKGLKSVEEIKQIVLEEVDELI